MEDPNVVEFLRATARERLSGVVGRKWRRLEDTLREGISLGESIEEIAGRITHQFDLSIAGARATARTEVINASNGGRLLGMSKSGVDQKEWLSARDGDVRGSRPGDRFDHAGADGITVDLDRPFIVSGESLMFPGDTSRGASAGNVVNCFIDPDTEILVHNGTKRIADVAEGDSVLTHQKRFKQVLRILSERFYDGEIFTVLTASGKIEVTPEHPVMTPGGWKRANELGYDDRVYTVAVFRRSSAIAIGGSFDDITDIGRRTVRDMRLYNFAVEEDESYIANNLVTHNCRCTISPVLRTQNESLALSMQNSLMRTIRWKQFVSEMSPVERAYAARLRAYFKSQREMTLRALGRLA